MSAPGFRRSFLAPLIACALLAGAAPVVSAQCFGPDNLDLTGPCCAPAVANLPAFNGNSLPGLAICWQQCSVATTNTLKVAWSPLVATTCAEYTSGLTVSDGGSGLPILTGKLVLDYTRTWTEIDTAGVASQVWRFTAKVDLQTVPGSPTPCAVPNCIAPLGPHPTAFFYGYMDYSGCAPSGPTDSVLVLYHAADRFIHIPGLSSTPGAFHPTQSYAIVAPHSSLQPFIPGNTPASFGPVVAEASRNAFLPGTIICQVEDPVTAGSIVKLGAGCLNTMTNNPKQQTARDFKGTTKCVNAAGLNGGWASLNFFPGLPWLHMVTTSIGTWSNPNLWPGKEQAWVDEGLFVHQDACLGDFIELKYGGSTRGGFTAVLVNPPITVKDFTDIADNWSAPLAGPFTFPILGGVQPTDRLIYVNEP